MNGRDVGGAPRKDGAHIRLYHSLMDSHAWHSLSPTDVVVFLAMRRQLNGGNNGNIEATLSTMKHWGIKSHTTLAKCLRTLAAVGLIENLRPGRMTHGGKVASLFRFTDLPTPANRKRDSMQAGGKATNDWAQWKTLGAAKLAIAQAHATSARGQGEFTHVAASKGQKMAVSEPDSVSHQARKWPLPARHEPETGVCQSEANARKPAPALGFRPIGAHHPDGAGKGQYLASFYKLPGEGAPALRGGRMAGLLSGRVGCNAVRLLRSARPAHVQTELNHRLSAAGVRAA